MPKPEEILDVNRRWLPPDQYRKSDSISDAIMLAWLELFQQETKQ